MKRRLSALTVAIFLLLTSCGGPAAEATTMKLAKIEGTVGVSDGEGKELEPAEDLGLYSGYEVDTRTASYAWVDLDEVKLTKMDENSEIEVQKEGKHLTIEVKSGSLFFNVTEPLANDETMDIRTSSMVVGIRGTCGWVEVSGDGNTMTLYLLEGTVECSAGGRTVFVNAGEVAVMTADSITVRTFQSYDIPAFVQEELTEALAERIEQETGLVPLPQDGSVLVLTLPVTSREISESWSEEVSTIIVRKGDDNVLRVTNDYYLYVGEGKTLVLEEGIQLHVDEFASIQSYGTLEVRGDLIARGMVWLEEESHTDIYGRLLNEDSGDVSNEGHLFVSDGIESMGEFSNFGTTEAHLEQNRKEYVFISGEFTGGIVLHDVLSASFSGDGMVDSVVMYDGALDMEGNSVSVIEQYGGRSHFSGGHVEQMTIHDGDFYIGHVWIDKIPSMGTLIQNGGESILSGGTVGSFVLSGGSAYVTDEVETGSITHNGGELTDNRG